jgi:apolipoprotein N-acyltransferase
VGSAQQQKLTAAGSAKQKYTNSAYLINADPKEISAQRYDKIRLMPFGEYLPLEGIIPWYLIKIPKGGSYLPGNEYTVFEGTGFRFSVTICWENLFPDLIRQFVNRGAQFMVNITNEARFGKTAAPYQFLSMSVFRAVENRIYFARCANTGISCIIDPFGNVTGRVSNGSGQDIFVAGVLTGSVLARDTETVYTRFGDFWVLICCAGSVLFFTSAFFCRPVRERSGLNH